MNGAYKKILIVFGTRPEAIKMAPIVNRLRLCAAVQVFVCVSAQHRQMLDQVLELFEIRPDYDLNLMVPNQTLAGLTARVLTGVNEVLESLQPDLVLVHGDTSTAFAASLACFYKKIPVAHVEAGLRSGDIHSPWPEELNRRIVGQTASLHFAPTTLAKSHLMKEGVQPGAVWVTGNTVIDALLDIVKRISADSALQAKLAQAMPWLDDSKRRLILVTGHRRENFGEGIEGVCRALRTLALDPDVVIVYPVHPNPNVMEPVHRLLDGVANVHLVEPMEYLPFVFLMTKAYFIITDSGGIQEEAPSLGKPVLVMRDTTERPEAVAAGTVRIVGSSEVRILEEARCLLSDPAHYAQMATAHNPYGDGHAAERVVKVIEGHFLPYEFE
jgi:UDP-N-acetylglucosamine 2-epimerase (non-hydrolysing)